MKTCLFCQKEIIITKRWEKTKKFCCQSCSARYYNAFRSPPTEEHKAKIRISVKKFWDEHPEKKKKPVDWPKKVGAFTKGQFKGATVETLLQLSKRTVSKIFKRLNVGCSRCGWNEASCDIHHIYGRKIEHANSHVNLTYLCPNCHRLFHCRKIGPQDVKNLQVYIGESWREVYYG